MMDQSVMKRCCTCGVIKPLTEYNRTLSGKHYQAQCNDCESLQVTPRIMPKKVGRGKPLFKEYSKVPDDDDGVDNVDKVEKIKCKTCNTRVDKRRSHQGLCPACWEKKRRVAREKRLKGLLEKIKEMLTTMDSDWFVAKTLAKYYKKGYKWAYTNLVEMEEERLVKSCYKDRKKYWKIVG